MLPEATNGLVKYKNKVKFKDNDFAQEERLVIDKDRSLSDRTVVKNQKSSKIERRSV